MERHNKENATQKLKGKAETQGALKNNHRFSAAAHISLCKEVLLHFPFDKPQGQKAAAWQRIKEGFYVSEPIARAMKVSQSPIYQHFKDLLAAFVKEEYELLRQSGSAEEWDELQQLLTDIFENKTGMLFLFLHLCSFSSLVGVEMETELINSAVKKKKAEEEAGLQIC